MQTIKIPVSVLKSCSEFGVMLPTISQKANLKKQTKQGPKQNVEGVFHHQKSSSLAGINLQYETSKYKFITPQYQPSRRSDERIDHNQIQSEDKIPQLGGQNGRKLMISKSVFRQAIAHQQKVRKDNLIKRDSLKLSINATKTGNQLGSTPGSKQSTK